MRRPGLLHGSGNTLLMESNGSEEKRIAGHKQFKKKRKFWGPDCIGRLRGTGVSLGGWAPTV